MKRLLLTLLILLSLDPVWGASDAPSSSSALRTSTVALGTIQGRVVDAKTNEAIELATVVVEGTQIAATTDAKGRFTLKRVPAGFRYVIVSFVGYERTRSAQIQVQGNQTSFVDILLPPLDGLLDELVVKPRLNKRPIESPLSVRAIGVEQIEKSAGANRDLSKLVQTLPGVGATDPNRNDLIVRGGGPSENVFYLDGIEIPVINHFSTQGASGGVVGIINPDFVRRVNFYSGAFPANRSGGLSSVMELVQRDAAQDRFHLKATVGASDLAVTAETPINANSGIIVGARQSYLQMLFKAIGLPFLPNYTDYQLKYKYRLSEHDELSIIALGSIDNMKLNTELQETGTESQRYLLGYLPVFSQWSYTAGAIYKHFAPRHIDSWYLSRNMLRNKSHKHLNNDESKRRTLDYLSDEVENKLRFERTFTRLPIKLTVGAGLKYATYTNDTYRETFVAGQPKSINYSSELSMLTYHAFAQASDEYWDKRLKLSLGVNLEGNNLSRGMKNPLRQIAPRLSASLAVTEDFDLNANIGRYAMRPAYTTLGFRDKQGAYVNQNENTRYILSDQLVFGGEYRWGEKLSLSLEGFYKLYHHYPVSLTDGISLASRTIAYGQVGDEAIISTGRGRAYGAELVAQLTDWHGLDLGLTYTLFRSEFTDLSGRYIPSSWDTRQQINLNATYKLGKGWYLAGRWRYLGGAPYTPIDRALSTDKQAWAVRNQAYLDYSRFNSERLDDSHQLDVRLDKEFYFKRWMLNLYIDIQNVYNAKSRQAPVYTNRDEQGRVMDDPAAPQTKQLLRQLKPTSGTILPTIGVMVRF